MNEIDALVEKYGPSFVVAALDEFLSEARKDRIEKILEQRMIAPTVVLENLYDPHNGAAVIRSAEAFGLSAVHVVAPAKRFRAASAVTIGAEKWLDVHHHENIAQCAKELRSAGFKLCALVPGASLTLEELPAAEKWALLLGNEQTGLSAEAVETADETVSLPMWGFSQSFNLSVSAALSLQIAAPARRKQIGKVGDLSTAKRAQLRARWYAQGMRGVAGILDRHASSGVDTDSCVENDSARSK